MTRGKPPLFVPHTLLSCHTCSGSFCRRENNRKAAARLRDRRKAQIENSEGILSLVVRERDAALAVIDQIRVQKDQALALLQMSLAEKEQGAAMFATERNMYLSQINGLQQQLADAQSMLAMAARFTCTPTPSPPPEQNPRFSTMF